ncbi:MAG: hypothetical protein B6244_07190 [Candidatus Cloacimonetes bacterium 4572_55]|nr:MAG: hypothetical protein B6244_07190 [Candidatus Cloacimonetes bacterium 4572_55]
MKSKRSTKVYFLSIFTILFFICDCARPLPETYDRDVNQKEIERIYGQAQSDYNKGDYRSVAIHGESLLSRYPHAEIASDVQKLVGDAYYKMDAYELAASAYQRFVHRYPNNPRISDVYHSSGYAYLALNNQFAAANSFLAYLDISDNFLEKQALSTMLTARIFDALAPPKWRELLNQYPQTDVSDELSYRLIRYHNQERKFDSVRSEASRFLRDYPRSQYRSEVVEIGQNLPNQAGSDWNSFDTLERKPYDGVARQPVTSGRKIGVICPLSGKYGQFGASVLKGMELAIKDFKEESGMSVDFVVRNSRGNAAEALHATRDLIYNEGVVAIVGPVLSECVISAGGISQQAQIPIITPTATGSEINLIGDYVFQFNNTSEQLGRAIAQFSIDNLYLSSFAILHPRTPYGSEMAEGFKNVVLERSATLLDVIDYPAGESDFQKEIRSLKSKSPECLFIPAEDRDILLIAPQINHYYFDTQLLGGNGWNSEKLIQVEGKNVNGAYFVDSYHNGGYHAGLNRFNERYFRQYHEEPDKIVALTYDSTRLLLAGIELGAETGPTLYEKLLQIKSYRGVTGFVTMENRRLHKHPLIFQILDNQIMEVSK